MKNRIEMTIPADVRYLELAAGCIRKMAALAGFRDEEIANIELAVDEGCTNVVMHAFEKDNAQSYRVICFFDTQTFTVELLDHGKSFHADTVPEPDVHAGIEERKTGGLGIYLIRKIMDDVRYSRTPDGLNRLVMIKNRSGSQTSHRK